MIHSSHGTGRDCRAEAHEQTSSSDVNTSLTSHCIWVECHPALLDGCRRGGSNHKQQHLGHLTCCYLRSVSPFHLHLQSRCVSVSKARLPGRSIDQGRDPSCMQYCRSKLEEVEMRPKDNVRSTPALWSEESSRCHPSQSCKRYFWVSPELTSLDTGGGYWWFSGDWKARAGEAFFTPSSAASFCRMDACS